MKKGYTLILFFIALGYTTLSSQVSVLFVDDSKDQFGNAELFHAAIEEVGYEATYYNAVDSAAGPSDLFMNNFDLVVWHTSSDESELLFWNGLDEDNASLKSYLNGGGNLWLSGNDFFFDRYGVAPYSFSLGDFAYDYLGVSSYDVQTYIDDGGEGVPIMLPDTNAVISGLNDLTWQFATLWYADGVSLVDDATPIYRMGDASYSLSDMISASYYDNGSSKVLSYFFDISLLSNYEMIKSNVLPVMNFFDNLILSNENVIQSTQRVNLYPNPVSNILNVEMDLTKSLDISISLQNVYGQVVTELLPTESRGQGRNVLQFSIDPSIKNGYYIVNIDMKDESIVKPILIQR